MGSLYHSGQGVPFSPIRACWSYVRAATPENPLRGQALALARAIQQDIPVLWDRCSAASGAIWGLPNPVSFALGPDHAVRIDGAGFVVSYRGTQKATGVQMGGPGWRFLPVRYTPLDVSHPAPVRRHFIEFFVWVPGMSSDQAWMLFWSVVEVIGADARPVLDQRILTADQPATSSSAGQSASLAVNAAGDVEWTIQAPSPRRGLIPFSGVAR